VHPHLDRPCTHYHKDEWQHKHGKYTSTGSVNVPSQWLVVTKVKGLMLELWYLTSLSTIFQLYVAVRITVIIYKENKFNVTAEGVRWYV
jgi:hypothetical protein